MLLYVLLQHVIVLFRKSSRVEQVFESQVLTHILDDLPFVKRILLLLLHNQRIINIIKSFTFNIFQYASFLTRNAMSLVISISKCRFDNFKCRAWIDSFDNFLFECLRSKKTSLPLRPRRTNPKKVNRLPRATRSRPIVVW